MYTNVVQHSKCQSQNNFSTLIITLTLERKELLTTAVPVKMLGGKINSLLFIVWFCVHFAFVVLESYSITICLHLASVDTFMNSLVLK